MANRTVATHTCRQPTGRAASKSKPMPALLQIGNKKTCANAIKVREKYKPNLHAKLKNRLNRTAPILAHCVCQFFLCEF